VWLLADHSAGAARDRWRDRWFGALKASQKKVKKSACATFPLVF
jgi:hypothetical protein